MKSIVNIFTGLAPNNFLIPISFTLLFTLKWSDPEAQCLQLESTKLQLSTILLIFLCFVTLLETRSARKLMFNIDELIAETQISCKDADSLISFVWYIPQEFWEASFAKDPSMSKEEVAEVLEILSEYEILALDERKNWCL